MYIKRLKIENYKGIQNIEINFTANKNKIEKDIKLNRFKILDNKVIQSIIVLVGCNSVGKTSIIEAISFLADIVTGFLNGLIKNQLINEEVNKDFDSIKINDFIKNKKIIKEIINSLSAKKGLYYEKYRTCYFEWFHEYHKNNSFDLSKEIFIELHFIDNEKESSYSIAINKEGEVKISNNGNIENKKIIEFLGSSILPKRYYSFKHNPHFSIPNLFQIKKLNYLINNKKNDRSNMILNLIEMIGEEKTIRLLKLCDPTIESIRYTKLQNGTLSFKSILLKNGSIIDTNSLSSGTLEFILIAEGIIRANNGDYKNGGLIIIDEIEKRLHKELVQALLYMLRMIFKNNNFQSIITTHNISFIEPEISTKQIYSIEKHVDNTHHIVKKVSSFMKPHESIHNKYESGIIAPYPDIDLAKEIIVDIMNDV